MDIQPGSSPDSQPLIEAENLSKRYKGSGTWAVKDISFTAGYGRVVGLIGENGAGKSTLLRMMATILSPSEGRIRIAGHDAKARPGDVRRSIGILFGQHSGLYERLTARENIHYFANLNGMRIKETEQKLEEISALLEMDDFLNRPAGTFSTGMRQKVLIARSIIHNPKVLMLDEPASGLDVTASRNIHRFIGWCREMNKTVVFSSHDLGAVERISDNVLVLHKGRLLASGPPSEISGGKTLEEHFFTVREAAQ